MSPGLRTEFFLIAVPAGLMTEVMSFWKKDGTRQVPFQAEILPMVLSKRAWAAKLKGQSVIEFIDNEAAICSLLKTSYRSMTGLHLIHQSLRVDLELGARFWYARVPSASNPADLPTRSAIRKTANEWNVLQGMVHDVLSSLVTDLELVGSGRVSK
eukprot:2523148-Amphidinium_carterae.1